MLGPLEILIVLALAFAFYKLPKTGRLWLAGGLLVVAVGLPLVQQLREVRNRATAPGRLREAVLRLQGNGEVVHGTPADSRLLDAPSTPARSRGDEPSPLSWDTDRPLWIFATMGLAAVALIAGAVHLFQKLTPTTRSWLVGGIVGLVMLGIVARLLGPSVFIRQTAASETMILNDQHLSWELTFLLALAALLAIAGLVFLFMKLTPSGRRWLGGGLAVFALMAFGFAITSDVVERPQPTETLVSLPVGAPQDRADAFSSGPTGDSAAPSDASNSSMDDKAESTKPAPPIVTDPDPNLPEWAKQPPHKRDDAYFVVVHSGTISDPGMREEALEVKMKAAADRYIDEILFRQGDVAEAVGIDAGYLKQHSIAEQYESGDLGRGEAYVQLKFDKRFRDEVGRRHHEAIATARVTRLGAITLGVLGVLGASLVVLRTAGGGRQAV